MPQNETIQDLDLDEYKYDFVTEAERCTVLSGACRSSRPSDLPAQRMPDWMLDFRLRH